MTTKNKQLIKGIFKTLIFLSFIASHISCDKNNNIITEKYQDFNDGVWKYDTTSEFEFEIKDTQSEYSLYYNIRNTLTYEYYNLYVKYQVLDPEGKLIRASMHETNLMEPKTGKPYGNPKPLGKAAANVYTSEVPIIEKIHFQDAGKYKFTIRHYMRNENLEGVMSVGVTVKKETQK